MYYLVACVSFLYYQKHTDGCVWGQDFLEMRFVTCTQVELSWIN